VIGEQLDTDDLAKQTGIPGSGNDSEPGLHVVEVCTSFLGGSDVFLKAARMKGWE